MKPSLADPSLAKPFLASACGRVNLIGEHTDYNGGFVLPTAIPQMTRIELWPRNDSCVRVESGNFPGKHQIGEYEIGQEVPQGDWLDYIQGVTRVLMSEGFSIRGFNLKIESHIPMGSGLSSSAALEISLLRGIRQIFNLPLDDIQIAQLGQKVENDFVGAKVGIMDPMAISLARPDHALFIDTRDLSFRHIPLPYDHMNLLVINSGVAHSNAGGTGYNDRRSECEKACKILGIRHLRDLNLSQLSQAKDRLSATIFKRARHVVTENERVLRAVEAIERKDINSLGQLFYDSHNSMREDYEVSTPEIDLLINLAKKENDVFGARLTGGGFGGSVVILTSVGKSKLIGEKLSLTYRKKTGKIPQIQVPE